MYIYIIICIVCRCLLSWLNCSEQKHSTWNILFMCSLPKMWIFSHKNMRGPHQKYGNKNNNEINELEGKKHGSGTQSQSRNGGQPWYVTSSPPQHAHTTFGWSNLHILLVTATIMFWKSAQTAFPVIAIQISMLHDTAHWSWQLAGFDPVFPAKKQEPSEWQDNNDWPLPT